MDPEQTTIYIFTIVAIRESDILLFTLNNN